jgi:hypothetical protein
MFSNTNPVACFSAGFDVNISPPGEEHMVSASEHQTMSAKDAKDVLTGKKKDD